MYLLTGRRGERARSHRQAKQILGGNLNSNCELVNQGHSGPGQFDHGCRQPFPGKISYRMGLKE